MPDDETTDTSAPESAPGAETEAPQNALENALLAVRDGRAPIEYCLRQLLASELFMLSTAEVGPDGAGFMPLLFDRDGVPLAAVYTTIERARAHQDMARMALRMRGGEIFARTPAGYGIVVNPGHQIGLEIPPAGVKEIVRDLSS